MLLLFERTSLGTILLSKLVISIHNCDLNFKVFATNYSYQVNEVEYQHYICYEMHVDV